MIMRIYSLRVLFAMIVLLCAACAGIRPVEPVVPDRPAETRSSAVPALEHDWDQPEPSLSRQESNALSASAAALEPLGTNLIAALLERRYTGYVRDFDTLWKQAHSDAALFYAFSDLMRARLGSCSGYHLSEISRRGEYIDMRSSVQCTQTDEPLHLRLVVRYDGQVPRIVFHSFSSTGAAGDEMVQ
jgi:hypothetical protein